MSRPSVTTGDHHLHIIPPSKQHVNKPISQVSQHPSSTTSDVSFSIGQPKFRHDVDIIQFYPNPSSNDSLITPTTLKSPTDIDSKSPDSYLSSGVNYPYQEDFVDPINRHFLQSYQIR